MGRKSNLLLMGCGGADVGGASTEFVEGQGAAFLANGYSSGTKTFADQNGASAMPDCLFLAAFLSNDATSADPADFSIGSTALTRLSTTLQKVQLWGAVVSSGETDDLTISNGSSFGDIGVASWWFTGPTMTLTPADIDQTGYGTQADPITLSSGEEATSAPIAVASGEFGFVMAGIINATADTDGMTISDIVGSPTNWSENAKMMIAAGYRDTADATWDPNVSGVTLDIEYKTQLIAASFGLA